jgi:GNAT superfamily N-acetyltransferase
MKELKKDYFIEKIYSPFPLINSILNGLQEGKIFSEGNCFFIFHKAAFSYLTSKNDIDYSRLLNFFLQSTELPEYFHIYDAPYGLIQACNENFKDVNIKLRKRVQLKFLKEKLALKNAIPAGYKIAKIEASRFEKLASFNLSIENKFWKSEDDFLANGFGFVLNNEIGLPVSICYSACIADDIAEIDVATLPEYQRKGLAKLVVSSFVQYCAENGITANWDCFENNYGSLKIAEQIGFKRIVNYNFLSFFNKTRNS